MAIYIVNSILVVAFSAIYSLKFKVSNNHKASGKKVYTILVFLTFTFIMALRANTVGVDTALYSRIYVIIGQSRSLGGAIARAPLSAPVYVCFCWLLYHISSNPQLLTVASSLMVTIGLFKYIEKVSDNIVISSNCCIGLTLLYASMNSNRQFMALVLVLNAFYYLSENLASKKGWILIIIAIGIHATAIFSLVALLGVVLANKLKENKLIFGASAIISVMISFGFSRIVPFVTRFIPRYEMYTSGASTYNILVSRGGGRIVLLYLFLFSIVVLWTINDHQGNLEQDAFNTRMLPAVVFGSVFGIFNCRNELINRMLWFYIALFITFIPSTIKKYHGNLKRLITYGIIIVLYSYSFISLLENQNGIVPYRFFWQSR